MITPLLTQLTYEGLVDELVGIKNCERPSYPPFRIIIDEVFSLCGTASVCSCAPYRSRHSANCRPVNFPYRPWSCSRSDTSG